MNVAAIVLARVLGYVEPIDLNPRGTVFYPEFTRELVERYNFQKFPQKLEEFDETKGVEFHQGRIGSKIIQKFVIWNSILVVETRTSTAESKEIMGDMITWAATRFNLNYRENMIRRYAYVSDLTFYSEAPMAGASPATRRLADRASRAVSDVWGESIMYQPLGFNIGHDPLTRKYGIAPFQIARRSEVPFSENKYFSEAPLPTDVHITLLEEYERDLLEKP